MFRKALEYRPLRYLRALVEAPARETSRLSRVTSFMSSEQRICIANQRAVENNTLAIDLSESWSNTTVVLNPIEKIAPVLNSEVLWQDVTNNSFYAYDGGVSWAVSVPASAPDNSLWEFIPSGSSGTWSQVPLLQQSTNFTSLVRTVGGASTSEHGLGFVLGGLQNGPTAGSVFLGAGPVPGLLIYNSSSQVWSNVSAFGYSNDGTSIDGAAQFVPSFGPNGLLLVVGGTVSGLTYSPTLLSTDTVSLYDPFSSVWKTQAVTGAVPPACINTCVVGAQGDNGTYEVRQMIYQTYKITNTILADFHVWRIR